MKMIAPGDSQGRGTRHGEQICGDCSWYRIVFLCWELWPAACVHVCCSYRIAHILQSQVIPGSAIEDFEPLPCK